MATAVPFCFAISAALKIFFSTVLISCVLSRNTSLLMYGTPTSFATSSPTDLAVVRLSKKYIFLSFASFKSAVILSLSSVIFEPIWLLKPFALSTLSKLLLNVSTASSVDILLRIGVLPSQLL